MEVATKNIPTNRSISPSRRKNKLSSHVSNFSGFGFRVSVVKCVKRFSVMCFLNKSVFVPLW